MSDFLDRMAAASRRRAEALRPRAGELEARARHAVRAARLDAAQLERSGFGLIAEIKPSSPSEGRLAACGPDAAAARAATYERAGACALSVLTEPTRFGGSLEHLSAAVRAVRIPVMRKDFLVDPLQVVEARAHGADGVLVVARMLDDARLAELVATARRFGMFTLLEAFSGEDLDRIGRLARQGAGDLFVGVNARDLSTLEVDPQRQRELATRLPAGLAAVAESGVLRAPDARTAARSGYRLALVGTALMRAPDPAAAIRRLLTAGRAAAYVSPALSPRVAGPRPEGAGRPSRRRFVKLCGLRTRYDVRAAGRADAVGLVLAPSPRRVSRDEAAELLAQVPEHVLRVAVLAEPVPQLVELAAELPFDALQCEPGAADVGGLTALASLQDDRLLIPSLRDGADLEQRLDALLAAAPDAIEPVLLDGPRGGGRGLAVDVQRAARVARRVPTILAGGLGPGNVAERAARVGAFGVDVSSGIERVRGTKDPRLMAEFVAAARGRAAQEAVS